MCSEAPDMSGANRAAEKQAELSGEQLAWAKELYAETAPDREAARTRAFALSDAMIGSMRKQDEIADETRAQMRKQGVLADELTGLTKAQITKQIELAEDARGQMRKQEALSDKSVEHYESTFKPMEARMVERAQQAQRDADEFRTPERAERAAGQAMADVGTQADIARANIRRELESRGVHSSSGNHAVALSAMGIREAAAKAAAANTARRQEEALGDTKQTVADAKLGDVVNLGRGVVTTQGTQAGLSLNAAQAAGGLNQQGVAGAQVAGGMGNNGVAMGQAATGMVGQAVNTGQAAGAQSQYGMQSGMAGAPVMQQGFQGAQAGLGGAANTYLGIARTQQAADDSGDFISGIANLGMAAGKMGLTFSDENMKEDIQEVPTSVALSQVRNMPVSSWKYKPGSVADDGGQEHVGPMAQDVQAAAGDEVAPGGKQIDLVSMNGIALSAVQELDKTQRQLKRDVASLSAQINGRGQKVRSKQRA
jgi:hypothetical protein